jgi:NADH-quinone oxidoreductase subunit E
MTNDSMPDGQIPDAKELERLKKQMLTLMPKDLTEATSLMAQPMVGAVALSALGFGMATQAFGMWMGAVAGAVEASQRVMNFDLPAGGTVADEASLPAKSKPVAVRTQSAVDTLIAEAKVAAEETVGPVARVVAKPTPEPTATKPSPVTSSKTAKPVVTKSARAKSAQAARADMAAAAKSAAVSKPAPKARPVQPDDLKAISGVGPKLETVLNGLGIWSYAQVASLTDGEIAWLDDYLGFKGRISRDGWVAQAKALAVGGKG